MRDLKVNGQNVYDSPRFFQESGQSYLAYMWRFEPDVCVYCKFVCDAGVNRADLHEEVRWCGVV